MLKTAGINKQLETACVKGDLKLVDALIKKGPTRSLRWKMAFRASCAGGNEAIVDIMYRKLIKKGEETLSADQWTEGLLGAATGGQMKMVLRALENGAHITLEALYCSCSGGNVDIVELFLKKPDCVDVDVNIAFSRAYEAGHSLLAYKFLEMGANSWKLCFLAAKLRRDKEMVAKMISLGAGYWSGSFAITLTFGDIAENNVGMQRIGELANDGFSKLDLVAAKTKFEKMGCKCELVHINNGLNGVLGSEDAENAYILVIRDAVGHILSAGEDNTLVELLAEQLILEWDTKAKMRGAVKNKNARYNLCYGQNRQEPDYENGNGRIVAFEDVPLTQKLQKTLPEFIGEKANNLVCEGNLYYDTDTTGIGYHGDSERRRVVAVRLGASIPLHYMWFKNGTPQGLKTEFILNSGDMYIMGSKAVGFDWKKKKTFTLRHAAGCSKYTTYKLKKPKKSTK